MTKILKKNIANLITLTRLVFTVILLYMLCIHKPMEADLRSSGAELQKVMGIIVCFIVICVSDFLDGKVARRLGITSEFGARFDVVTDLFYVFSTFVIFGIRGLIPFWFVFLMFEKTANFFVTSNLIQKKKKDKFAFIRDPIGRIVSASYFLVPVITFLMDVYFREHYGFVYIIMVILGIAGIGSSLYRDRMVIGYK